jgi:nucleotide-binding universal stress UspA family protein
MKILIAVDGSAYTKRMLAHIAAHEQWLNSAHQYTVLTAVMALPPRAAKLLQAEVIATHYTDEAERVFKPLRSFFKKHAIDAQFVSKVGHAPEVIAKTAATGRHELIMMGSHGHSAMRNWVMGSVTTKVLAHCDIPVLLVR